MRRPKFAKIKKKVKTPIKGEITFVSQTERIFAPGSEVVVIAYQFYVVTPGGMPLKLEYSTPSDAAKAKAAILQSENTFMVQGVKTFQAIVEAMDRLMKLAIPKNVKVVEPTYDDVNMLV